LGLITPLSWDVIGLVWVYCIAWVFILDWVKLRVYQHIELTGSHHRRFVGRTQQLFHSHAS
jgi:H+-transporting ATPase